jgi:hypothetical protein
MVISKSVVILYNGGVKTKNNPLDCPNVAPHFSFAAQVTREIDKLLIPPKYGDSLLIAQPGKLISPDGNIIIKENQGL